MKKCITQVSEEKKRDRNLSRNCHSLELRSKTNILTKNFKAMLSYQNLQKKILNGVLFIFFFFYRNF